MPVATGGVDPRARLVGALIAVTSACCLAGLARRRYARRVVQDAEGAAPGVLADDGVWLHVETEGPCDAPLTVVFTHGFSASMDEYERQRSSLRDEHRLVLFDHRGHGRSGWGGRRSATLSQLGRDLGRVIDECTGSGPVVLVGHSLGGMAIMALARSRVELFGDKVVGVALMSTSAGRLTLGSHPAATRALRATGALRALLWWIWFAAPLTARLGPFRTQMGRRVLRRRLFGLDAPPEHLVTQVQAMWSGTSHPMAAAFYPGMLTHDTTGALSTIGAVPSLVLTGAADATIAAWHSERIVEQLGGRARLVRVPRAGHMVNMTHPDVVNEALSRLLAELRGATTPGRPGRAEAAAGCT